MESMFCSNFSKKSGEPIAGSAPHAEYFIFISWPKKFWGYDALQASGGFPKGLKNWMKKNSNIYGKISIRLASNKSTTTENSDIFIYPGKYVYSSISPENIIDILDLHFEHLNKSSNKRVYSTQYA